MNVAKSDYQIKFSCPGADEDGLVFESMEGTDAFGRLFEYQIQLTSQTKIDRKKYKGKNASICLEVWNSKRYFNGIITNMQSSGDEMRGYVHTLTLSPSLWLLDKNSGCRVFQKKSAAEIIKSVCNDDKYGGLINLDITGVENNEKMISCTQYNETDLNFIQRLMERFGLYFYFEHSENNHQILIIDSHSTLKGIDNHKSIPYFSDTKTAKEPVIFEWEACDRITTENTSSNDFDLMHVSACANQGLVSKRNIETESVSFKLEHYFYPGDYIEANKGRKRVLFMAETNNAERECYFGASTLPHLGVGHIICLDDNPHTSDSTQYVITECTHTLHSDTAPGDAKFSCKIKAVVRDAQYRPAAVAQTPQIACLQTATVTGPSDEEIHVDEHFRIKVKLHWDTSGTDDDKSSAWVPVLSPWAGNGFGIQFPPRVGMIALLMYPDGSPFKTPMAIGFVYHPEAPPPVNPEKNKTCSTIRSRSSKKGNGYNEICFDDEKDSEQFTIQAEKDMTVVIKNNQSIKIGFEKKDKGDQTLDIQNDQTSEIGHNQTIHVKNNQSSKIDKKCLIEAGEEILIKVGSSSLKLEKNKITLKTETLEVEGTNKIDIKSPSGKVTIEGNNVSVEAHGMASIKSDGSARVEGAGVTIEGSGFANIKGGMVKIN